MTPFKYTVYASIRGLVHQVKVELAYPGAQNDRSVSLVADARLCFEAGPLAGETLEGFQIWKRPVSTLTVEDLGRNTHWYGAPGLAFWVDFPPVDEGFARRCRGDREFIAPLDDHVEKDRIRGIVLSALKAFLRRSPER